MAVARASHTVELLSAPSRRKAGYVHRDLWVLSDLYADRRANRGLGRTICEPLVEGQRNAI